MFTVWMRLVLANARRKLVRRSVLETDVDILSAFSAHRGPMWAYSSFVKTNTSAVTLKDRLLVLEQKGLVVKQVSQKILLYSVTADSQDVLRSFFFG